MVIFYMGHRSRKVCQKHGHLSLPERLSGTLLSCLGQQKFKCCAHAWVSGSAPGRQDFMFNV